MNSLKVVVLSDNSFGIRERQMVAKGYFPTIFFEMFEPAISELTIVGKPIENDAEPDLHLIQTNICVNLILYPHDRWNSLKAVGAVIGIARFVLRLAKYLRTSDIVLAKWFSFRSFVGVILMKILHIPSLLVLQIVGDPIEAFRGRYRRANRHFVSVGSRILLCLTKWMISQCDMVYAVSDQLRKKYVADGKPCVVASESRLQSAHFWRHVRPLVKRPLLLFVGRLEEVKGVDYLLEALSILRSWGHNYRLRIIGSGSQMMRYREFAERLGLADSIEWLGFVPFDKLINHYREAHLFVLPSLSEGLPLVVLEAMASSLPVVAARVGGVCELVDDGRNGFLVPPANPMALAKAIQSILEHHEQYKVMAENAYLTALMRTEIEERRKAARAITYVFSSRLREKV